MALARYRVMRPHFGDKQYETTGENSIREADPIEVAHLVANGVLVEIQSSDEPVEAAPKTEKRNKAKE